MKKEIKNYLHLYLGQEILTSQGIGKLLGINGNTLTVLFDSIVSPLEIKYDQTIKLLLFDMMEETEETSKYSNELFQALTNDASEKDFFLVSSELFRYKIEKGYDLFGLIDENLAINKI